MEKKVLLQDLVETGRNIRKQIISKVVCCDRGVHPIGEIWDANKTINTIVAGATEAQDTLKEVEDKLNGEINRAKAAENNLNTIKTGRINADSITQLTDEQIDSLKAGDTVIKGAGDKKHAYVVAYKKDDEMSLVYADHENIEEVYYEKQNGTWTYVQTDNFALQSIPANVSYFNNDAGYLTSHQDLTSIISRIEALELAAGITQPQEEEPQEEEPVE